MRRFLISGLILLTMILVSGCTARPGATLPSPGTPAVGPDPGQALAGSASEDQPSSIQAPESPSEPAPSAPEQLPWAPIATWKLAAGEQPVTMLGSALITQRAEKGSVTLRALATNDSVVWSRELPVSGPSNALEWAVSASGNRIATWLMAGSILVLDGRGATIAEFKDPGPGEIRLQFVGDDNHLLVRRWHGLSKVERETESWYDLSIRPPQLVESMPGAWAAGASRAPFVAVALGPIQMYGPKGLEATTEQTYQVDFINAMQVSADGQWILVSEKNTTALFRSDGTLAWERPTTRAGAILTDGGDVWTTGTDGTSNESTPVVLIGKEFGISFRSVMLGKDLRIVGTSPTGEWVVTSRSGESCAVTTKGDGSACTTGVLQPAGNLLLEITGDQVRAFAWPK